MTASTSLFIALGLTTALALLHVSARHLDRLPFVPPAATGSFAGGASVAYVFLHLLPELTEGQDGVGEALGEIVDPSPLTDLGIFLVALVGFTLFFTLEQAAGRGDVAITGDDRPPAVFYLHLASFCALQRPDHLHSCWRPNVQP